MAETTVKRTSWAPSGRFGAFVGRLGSRDDPKRPAVCAIYNVAQREMSHVIDLAPFNNFNQPLVDVSDAWSQLGEHYFYLTGVAAQYVVQINAKSGGVQSHRVASGVMKLTPSMLGDKVIVERYKQPWSLIDFSATPPSVRRLNFSARAEAGAWSPSGEHLVVLNIAGAHPSTLTDLQGITKLCDGGLETRGYNAYLYDATGEHKRTIDFTMNGLPRAIAWPPRGPDRFAVIPSIDDNMRFFGSNLEYEDVFGAPVEIFISKDKTDAEYHTLAHGDLQAVNYRLGNTFGSFDAIKITQDLRFSTVMNRGWKSWADCFDMVNQKKIGRLTGVDDVAISSDGAKLAWSKKGKLGITSFPLNRHKSMAPNISVPSIGNSSQSLIGLTWLGEQPTQLAFRQKPSSCIRWRDLPAPLIAEVLPGKDTPPSAWWGGAMLN